MEVTVDWLDFLRHMAGSPISLSLSASGREPVKRNRGYPRGLTVRNYEVNMEVTSPSLEMSMGLEGVPMCLSLVMSRVH